MQSKNDAAKVQTSKRPNVQSGTGGQRGLRTRIEFCTFWTFGLLDFWTFALMAQIHPTAIIDPSATLADSAVVGPYCVIGPNVRIGEGTVLHNHVAVQSNTTIGRENSLYPFSVLGADPQDR